MRKKVGVIENVLMIGRAFRLWFVAMLVKVKDDGHVGADAASSFRGWKGSFTVLDVGEDVVTGMRFRSG